MYGVSKTHLLNIFYIQIKHTDNTKKSNITLMSSNDNNNSNNISNTSKHKSESSRHKHKKNHRVTQNNRQSNKYVKNTKRYKQSKRGKKDKKKKKKKKGDSSFLGDLFTLESSRCVKACLKRKYKKSLVKKDKKTIKNSIKNRFNKFKDNLTNLKTPCPCALIRHRTMKRQKKYYYCCKYYDKDPSKCDMIIKFKSRRKRKCRKLGKKLSKIKNTNFLKTFKTYYNKKLEREHEDKKAYDEEQDELERPANEDYIRRYYHCCKKENKTFRDRGKCNTFSNMCRLFGRRKFEKLMKIPYYKKYYKKYKEKNL